jgi:hypothetical protein
MGSGRSFRTPGRCDRPPPRVRRGCLRTDRCFATRRPVVWLRRVAAARAGVPAAGVVGFILSSGSVATPVVRLRLRAALGDVFAVTTARVARRGASLPDRAGAVRRLFCSGTALGLGGHEHGVRIVVRRGPSGRHARRCVGNGSLRRCSPLVPDAGRHRNAADDGTTEDRGRGELGANRAEARRSGQLSHRLGRSHPRQAGEQSDWRNGCRTRPQGVARA